MAPDSGSYPGWLCSQEQVSGALQSCWCTLKSFEDPGFDTGSIDWPIPVIVRFARRKRLLPAKIREKCSSQWPPGRFNQCQAPLSVGKKRPSIPLCIMTHGPEEMRAMSFFPGKNYHSTVS